MSKLIIKTVIVLIFIFLSALSTFATEVDIAAENLEYLENVGKIIAQDHVVLNWKDKKVYADYVEFDINAKTMNAYGNIKVEESGSLVHANAVSYNYNDETGEINETFAYFSSMFVRSKSMERLDKNTFALHHIKLSANCDLDDPHTYFRARRGKLVVDKRITIYNAVLYVGKMPIFYLPVVTKSLKTGRGFGSRLKFEVVPGHTNSGGFSLNTAVSCSLSENVNVKLKYDYFDKRRDGYGTEINYITDDHNPIGSLSAYTTEDLTRWQVRPNYFHKLNNQWTIRSQANFMSDSGFTNSYNRSNWKRTQNHLESDVTLTRQGRKSNLLLDVGYNADADYDSNKYKTSLVKLPRVALDIYHKDLGMGIMQKPYWQYSHNYAQYSTNNYFFKNTSLFSYTLTKKFIVGRRLVLKPSLVATENFYDKDDTESYENAFFTQYGGSLNTRFRTTSWMDWTVTYLYRARTKPNCFDVDVAANDYGIEANSCKFSNCIYLGDRITISNAISYRFNTPKQWWLPLVTELKWTPKCFITVYAKEEHLVTPCKFNALQLDVKIGELEKAYLNLGAFFQNYTYSVGNNRNHAIKNTLGFGVWLTPKWRLDYMIRTAAPIDFSYIRIDEQEIRLYRDLHCWNFGIGLWKTNSNQGVGDQGIYFKFNFKTNMPFSKSKDTSDYEDQDPKEIFYPWRGETPLI